MDDQCHKCYWKIHPDMVTDTEGWCYWFDQVWPRPCPKFLDIKKFGKDKQELIDISLTQVERIGHLKLRIEKRNRRIAKLEEEVHVLNTIIESGRRANKELEQQVEDLRDCPNWWSYIK